MFLEHNLVTNPSSTNSSLTDSATSVFNVDDTIVVFNKIDLLSEEYMSDVKIGCEKLGMKISWVSCKTSDGVETFMHQMKDMLRDM